MDTFEQDNNQTPYSGNQEQPQAAPQHPQEETPNSGYYAGAGAGRKESPYANSPYVSGYQPGGQEYHYQPQPPREKPRKSHPSRKPVWRSVISAVLVVVLVVSGCAVTAAVVDHRWERESEAAMAELNEKIDDLQSQIGQSSSSDGSVTYLPSDGDTMTPSQVYSQNVDCVVAISSTIQSTSFYGTTSGTSSGSGFILTEDGYIVTNYHVVEGASDVTVTLHDGTSYSAELQGYDSTNDLAVLKIDATGLSAAAIGSSSELNIGDMVVAIGNPLGTLASTQTVGYVSGINREVTTDNTVINMIQTDCAINPGNSGGPLFNMKGEVIGITTAKYSGTTTSGATIEGIGFAIPIDDVMDAISDLMDYGYVTSGYLGVSVTNVDEDSASMYGLPTGAYVVSVESGHCAEAAGVQPKDIITAIGDTTISNVSDLTRALRNYSAGDTTTLTVVRGGSELTLDITLDEKTQDSTTTTPDTDAEMPSEGNYDEWYDYFRRYFGD